MLPWNVSKQKFTFISKVTLKFSIVSSFCFIYGDSQEREDQKKKKTDHIHKQDVKVMLTLN